MTDIILTAHTPPTPTAPAVPTAPPAPVESHSHSGLSPTEAATMAGWVKEDLARGKITQAQADVVFGELNTPMEDRVTKDDTRSEEVKLIDTHFPAAKPEEFSIPYFTPGQAPPVMPKELQQFDQSARTWLAGAQFDRTLGNSLVTTISRVAQHTKAMTPDQLNTYGEN